MPRYVWHARGPQGQERSGEIEAPSVEAARARLRARGLRPDDGDVVEKGRGLQREIRIPGLTDRVSTREMAAFLRQLATMLGAGLPMLASLELLAAAMAGRPLGKVAHRLRTEIEAGSGFAAALRRQPRVFDPLCVSLATAGEAAGVLDEVLSRLADTMEKSARLKSRVRGAFLYPAVILSVAAGVTALLLGFVVPVFVGLFAGLGHDLPAPTRFVVGLSDALRAHGLWAAVAGGILVGVAVDLRRRGVGREVVDAGLLRIPGVGGLLRKAAVARVTRTLATLVSAGVPILDGLAITSTTAGNAAVEAAVRRARFGVATGGGLAATIEATGIFPPLACRMIAVGEVTGALDAMLGRVADLYEEEVEGVIDNLSALLEPLLILVLGGLIGGLVVAMYLPIFRLGAALG